MNAGILVQKVWNFCYTLRDYVENSSLTCCSST